jgi:hypothetical protein
MKKSCTCDLSLQKPIMERAMSMELPEGLKPQKRLNPTHVCDLSCFNQNKENQAPNIFKGTSSFGTQLRSAGVNDSSLKPVLDVPTLSLPMDPWKTTSSTVPKETQDQFGAHLDTAIAAMDEELSELSGPPLSMEEIEKAALELEREQAAAQTLLQLHQLCCLDLPPPRLREPIQRSLYSIPVESAHLLPQCLRGETPVSPQLYIGCTVPPVAENRVGVMTRAQTRIGKALTTFGGMVTTESLT